MCQKYQPTTSTATLATTLGKKESGMSNELSSYQKCKKDLDGTTCEAAGIFSIM